VQLRDITDEKIELAENSLTFSGESDKHKYAFNLEFHSSINKEDSKWTKTGFHLLFVLEKHDANAPFWPRLLKNKDKNQYISVDWSKWVDEDEEEEDGQKGLGGIDPSQMQSTYFVIEISEEWAAWAAWEEWEEWVDSQVWVEWEDSQVWAAWAAWAAWVECKECKEWVISGVSNKKKNSKKNPNPNKQNMSMAKTANIDLNLFKVYYSSYHQFCFRY
jgi:hypothetical protein